MHLFDHACDFSGVARPEMEGLDRMDPRSPSSALVPTFLVGRVPLLK